MRQYRGLTKDGKWVYGEYISSGSLLSYIVPESTVFTLGRNGLLLQNIYSVNPETVGQFVKVINGKDIWEGDLLTGHRLPKRDPFIIEWDESITAFRLPYSYNEKELEVIGNIHTEK